MKTILIVDDQSEVRELVSATLAIGLYRILTAADSQEGLAVARAEQPDVILLDVQLLGSELDGFEVCYRLKHDERTRASVVIMLTGKASDADRQRGFASGADDYFVKPFSPLELIRRVEQILE